MIASLSHLHVRTSLGGLEADVGTAGLAVELDEIAGGVCLGARGLERGGNGGDVKHAATVGHDVSVGIDGGAGMIHGHALELLGPVDARDDLALLVAAPDSRRW